MAKNKSKNEVILQHISNRLVLVSQDLASAEYIQDANEFEDMILMAQFDLEDLLRRLDSLKGGKS